uniref:Ig-like domain-containing protein n=1 Tax=Panthera tigris altaica TaxID=74533 RepID=A0A8C9K9W4_PANTA
MTWTPLFLFPLLTHYPGATSQEVVTQETSLSTTPGGTVTLTCGSSTGAVTTSNYATWVQQKPYQRFQGLIGETSYRNPGVPARFSGSLVGQKAVLTITGAQSEDEAEYYCVLWFSNHYHRDRGRWGSETQTPGLTLCSQCHPSSVHR